MTDIWDEKPRVSNIRNGAFPNVDWYSGIKMDAWLEKMKAECDNLKSNHKDVWSELRRQTVRHNELHRILEAVKNTLDGSQSGSYFLPEGGYNINKLRDELRNIVIQNSGGKTQ